MDDAAPRPAAPPRGANDLDPRAADHAGDAPAIRAMRFRAWHRGTREADFMIGGFFDRHHAGWTPAQAAWYARVLDEDDVDVMAWMLGRTHPPAHLADDPVAAGMIAAMRRLDYIIIP